MRPRSALLRTCYELLEPNGGLYLTTFVPHAELEGEVPENEWYEDRTLVLPDQISNRRGHIRKQHLTCVHAPVA